MSRNLPTHPNIEHLRKQAKDLRRKNPASRLAEAQHTIALEYGFMSWPKLKTHVESLTHLAAQEALPVAAQSNGKEDGGANGNDGAPSDDSQSTGPENPFVGTWTANLSKSRLHPNNQFQAATIQFAMAGSTLTINDVVVNASGHQDHGKNTIQVDGNEHPSEHGNGYVLMARWRGSHVLKTEAKKDGQSVGWGLYEVSADGKTLTISSDEQMIVLDRA